MKAYLSGAMEFAGEQGRQWRDEMEHWLQVNLDHTVFNPVRSTTHLVEQEAAADFRTWKTTDLFRFRKFVRRLIDNDIAALKTETDYVICLWDRQTTRGGGTHAEVTLAYYFRKPVYLIRSVPLEDISGWILACTAQVFNSMDDLKNYLLNTYGP